MVLNKTSSPQSSETSLFHSGILYIDLPIARLLLASTDFASRLYNLPNVQSIEQLSYCLGGLHSWCNEAFDKAQLDVVPLEIDSPLAIGDVRSFQFGVRTRNVGYWGVSKMNVGLIFRKSKSFSFELAIDPCWVTGDHSYVKLRSGNTILCGFFVISEVDSSRNTIRGKPIVLGEPCSANLRRIEPQFSHLLCKSPPTQMP